MPVLVNYKRCNCMPTCFAANACPKETLRVDRAQMKVMVDASVCGDCPAPCLNFCDAVALKYAPTLEELDIVQRELDGVLTVEAAQEERKALAEKRKAAEAAAKEQEERAKYAPVKLTVQNFVEEISREDTAILIDFWADWCGPCKQIEPTINDLAVELAGKIRFGKVNVDEEQSIAMQLGIQSIPTMMIFYAGQLVTDPISGVVPKESLKNGLLRIIEAVEKMRLQNQAEDGQPGQVPARQTPTPKMYKANLRPSGSLPPNPNRRRP